MTVRLPLLLLGAAADLKNAVSHDNEHNTGPMMRRCRCRRRRCDNDNALSFAAAAVCGVAAVTPLISTCRTLLVIPGSIGDETVYANKGNFEKVTVMSIYQNAD